MKYPNNGIAADSATLKEMFLGTWIRGCNKGPRSLFKMQTHNRGLKKHLMNGIMEIIYSGARGFLGSRNLLNDCRVLRAACHSGRSSTGIQGGQGPSPTRRGTVMGSRSTLSGNGCACDFLSYLVSSCYYTALAPKEPGTGYLPAP